MIKENKLRKKIELSLIYGEVIQKSVATALGVTTGAFHSRLKACKFKIEELEIIAESLGAKYVAYFEFPDGYKVTPDNVDSETDSKMKAMIMAAQKHSHVTQTRIAASIGLTPQEMYVRLKVCKFKLEELEKMASTMWATYTCYFEFPDGRRF